MERKVETEEKSFSSKIKSFDFYRKLPQDLSDKSSTGGIVSLICAIIIIALMVSEFSRYLKTEIRSEMVIDLEAGHEEIQLNIDIVFMRVPCPYLIVEGRDTLYSEIKILLKKQRLNKYSEPLEYEKEDAFAMQNIPDSNLEAMIRSEEGCQIVGSVLAKRVTGYLYINQNRLSQTDKFPNKNADFSHKIRHFSFGNPQNLHEIKSHFTALLNPLDYSSKEIIKDSPSTLFQYYLNVVPIKFKPELRRPIPGYQYTANSHKVDFFHKNTMVFKYDISPISVNYSVERESIFHFLVQICAIIGGIFTIARVIDSVLDKAFKNRGKKADLE